LWEKGIKDTRVNSPQSLRHNTCRTGFIKGGSIGDDAPTLRNKVRYFSRFNKGDEWGGRFKGQSTNKRSEVNTKRCGKIVENGKI